MWQENSKVHPSLWWYYHVPKKPLHSSVSKKYNSKRWGRTVLSHGQPIGWRIKDFIRKKKSWPESAMPIFSELFIFLLWKGRCMTKWKISDKNVPHWLLHHYPESIFLPGLDFPHNQLASSFANCVLRSRLPWMNDIWVIISGYLKS